MNESSRSFFRCNHPEKAVFLENNSQPVIEGQLKEKKGKWRLFRRWRTRYFTLSGAHLSCKGSVMNFHHNNSQLLIILSIAERRRIHRHQSNPLGESLARCTQHSNLLRDFHGKPNVDFKADRRREGRRVGSVFKHRCCQTLSSP